jgi:hypothetical protein
MIHEFQGRRLLFQLPHMRDMMDAKDDNYKHVGHTTHAPIEINEKFTILTFGTNCDNLPKNKMYVVNIDETRLYKQPLSMLITSCRVNFIKVPMTL